MARCRKGGLTMTITYELDLNSFEAWSGAKDTLDRIQREANVQNLKTY